MNSITSIKICDCYHAFQDSQYGPTKRVHNQCKEGWRCTSCGGVKKESHGKKKSKNTEESDD